MICLYFQNAKWDGRQEKIIWTKLNHQPTRYNLSPINEWTNEHKEPFAAKYIYLKKPWKRSVVSQTLSQFISLISNPSSLQMTANYVFWYV